MGNSQPTARHKPQLKAIIFDLGGTLIYFQGEWPDVMRKSGEAFVRSLNEVGILIDSKEFLPRLRIRLEQYYTQRDSDFIEYTTAYVLRNLLAESGFSNVPEPVLQRALRAMFKVSQTYWQPEYDATPTLMLLRQQGFRLGLISNASDDADVQALVDKAGLRPYFELIMTSAAAGVRKPNPRIFQTMLNTWQIEPQNAVMVGDTLGADILGAHNAGLMAIWITRHADTSANRAHLDTVIPDATILNLGELPDLLAGYR